MFPTFHADTQGAARGACGRPRYSPPGLHDTEVAWVGFTKYMTKLLFAIVMGLDAVGIDKTIHPYPTHGKPIEMVSKVAHGSCMDAQPKRKPMTRQSFILMALNAYSVRAMQPFSSTARPMKAACTTPACQRRTIARFIKPHVCGVWF